MNNLELEQILNLKLNSEAISDYAPNGLQVEGKSAVSKIVTGVTACQALLDYAVEQQADAVLVHHGYFWKNENPLIRDMKGERIRTLLAHNINLYAYHLPLDVHPELGNNALLAEMLGIENLQSLEKSTVSIPVYGELKTPLSSDEFAQRLENVLQRKPLHCGGGIYGNAKAKIRTVGLCTGGGQDYLDLAAAQGLDAFISGEISERTTHSAREQGIHFFAAGHHATERCGIQKLGEWLQQHYGLEVLFKDIENPA
ncbi:Nif3-like dinuclear metal center hexameric protein [Testudinibacter sp. P27/CKL/0425]